MAVRTGAQFLEGLRDGREVWLEGERVMDVTTHPKLSRMAGTLAALYDLQHDPDLHSQMTFESPSTGDPIGYSYVVPRSQDDLLKRRRALEITAGAAYGMLGRTPDYVNMAVTAMRQMASFYGRNEGRFADNVIAYHEFIREGDLCLTHAFSHPQVNKAASASQLPDPYVAVGIVDSDDQGVVIRGAKSLATLAPFADEIFAPIMRPLLPDPEEEKYCIGFALPVSTPGVKIICRESYDLGRSLYDYPLSGQYDEMDGLVVFDNVLVPWERVFAYRDVALANEAIGRVPMWRQFMQQVAVKNIAKLEFILGLVYEMAEAIGRNAFTSAQENIAEIVDTLETVRAFLRAAEADAGPYEGEGIWPAPEPWTAMRHWYPDAYVRVVWIVEQLAASGLMLTPTEADVNGPLAETIGKYYQGVAIDAPERVRLFRLAWDLVGTQYGSRQALYERFFNGDVVQLRQRRYASYDYTRAREAVRSFFERTGEPQVPLGVGGHR